MDLIPCYVVNLDSDKKKWEDTTSTLSSLGIKHERFPAVYGKKLSPEYIKEITHASVYYNQINGRSLDQQVPTLGAIGCYLSHVGIWQKLVESDSDMCLVFEDDLAKTSSLKEVEDFVDTVPKGWDFIYLGYYKPLPSDGYDIRKDNYYKVKGMTYMTHSYLVSKQGATKLLKSALPIFCQIDSHISFLAARGDIEAYRPIKSMFNQNLVTSLSSNCQERLPPIKILLTRFSNTTIVYTMIVIILLLIFRKKY